MERDPVLPPAPHIAVFDGLRGMAILMVLAIHANAVFRAPSPLDEALQQGVFGVQVFFAVSAATLMMASRRRRSLELAPFAVRRIARIAPLYLLGALFYVGVHVMDDQRRAPLGILLNALFVHGFVPEFQNTIVPGGWSIGCEMAFYALFPLLFRVITNFQRAVLALGIACAVDLALIKVGHLRGWSMVPAIGLYYHPVFQLPVFMAGIAAYHATRKVPAPTTPRRVGMHALAASSLVGIVGVGEIASSHPTLVAAEIVPVALLVGMLVYACVSAPPRLLTNPPMVRLGLISYSVYIWHFAVLFGLLRHRRWIEDHHGAIPLILGFALTLALTWPVAEMSRRFIELPGIAWGRRIIEGLRASSNDAAPAL